MSNGIRSHGATTRVLAPVAAVLAGVAGGPAVGAQQVPKPVAVPPSVPGQWAGQYDPPAPESQTTAELKLVSEKIAAVSDLVSARSSGDGFALATAQTRMDRVTEAIRQQIEARGRPVNTSDARLASGVQGASASVTASLTSGSGWATLGLNQQPEQLSYWCGPSAAAVALSARGVSQTQTQLAPSLLTGSATTWSSHKMRDVLNWFTSGGNAYVDANAPSPTQIQSFVQWDVGRGWAVNEDIVELAGTGTFHIPGHPTNRTIGHWITLDGWNNSGTTIEIKDPAANSASLPDFAAAQPTAKVSTANLSAIGQSNGITW